MLAENLAKYCEDCLKIPTIYMWGGLFRVVTKDYIERLKAQYPTQYSKFRCEQLNEVIAKCYGCDCAGLIKSFVFGGIGSPNYDPSKDVGTSGMFMIATEKGNISKMPEQRGIITYMKGHVGVYIGSGKVIECTLGEYGDGVVKTRLSGRGWTHFLKLPWFDYGCSCNCGCPVCDSDYELYTVRPGDS